MNFRIKIDLPSLHTHPTHPHTTHTHTPHTHTTYTHTPHTHTHTHTPQYVILIAFPLQQWLRERAHPVTLNVHCLLC